MHSGPFKIYCKIEKIGKVSDWAFLFYFFAVKLESRSIINHNRKDCLMEINVLMIASG